jgi:N-acetylmuramoyl-L-alanine amidase
MLCYKKFYKFLIFFYFFNNSLAWSENSITKISSIDFNQEKIFIKLSNYSKFKIFTLNNPNRVAVEIINAQIDDKKNIKFPEFIKEISFDKNPEKLVINIFFHQNYLAKNISFDKKTNVISFDLNAKENSIAQIIDKSIEIETEDSLPQDLPINEIANNNIKKTNNLPIEKPKSQLNNSIKAETSSIKNHEIITKKTANSLVKYKIRNPDSTKTDSAKTDSAKTDLANKNDESSATKPIKLINKKPVIVIDAGHGGKDPGTIGIFARSKEKNITLSYAKELAKQLAKEKKYKIYLTRDSDIFIPLDKRVAKSRRKKADLFISLHANSIADNQISGFSIYTLSENSSDKQAELLAQKENQADIINGIDFSGASGDITKTLIDLSQRESKNNSARLAKYIIREIKSTDIEILQNTHRFAGFMVLTAPDMASVLIELGYLSNKHEEKLLNSLGYKRLVAKSLANSIKKYFENYNL